jgi:ribonuclease E
MASRDGYTVCVGDAADLVGKTVKVRVERFVDGMAYATLVSKHAQAERPITAEDQAEKPTRKPPARRAAGASVRDSEPVEGVASAERVGGSPEKIGTTRKAPTKKAAAAAEPEEPEEPGAEAAEGTETAEPKPKKKTRRGSRGGRGRKKKATAEQPAEVAAANGGGPAEEATAAPKIHLPEADLGHEEAEPPAEGEALQDGTGAPKKKRTRRGTRGGRNRRKKTATATAAAQSSAEQSGDPASEDYVPMAEWIEEVEPSRTR